MAVERMWRINELKTVYDVVIIGAGVHGLAIAYYLGKRGITNVAVLDKGYIGGGASGRNTAIIRSNYRTPQGITFYDASVKLYEKLALELDYNIMFSQQGHLTVAHTERGATGLRERAETNNLLGVDSRMVTRPEIAKLVPGLDVSDKPHQPILAGLYHPPGGIIRHDAVVWAYARGADRFGIEIHPFTEVKAIHAPSGSPGGTTKSVQAVVTSKGSIATP